jgi:hypothetical protein
VSYALEFYSLSWEALKAALVARKPALMTAIEERHWDNLLDDSDLGELDDEDDLRHPAAVIADAFDEIAEAMAQKVPPGHDPPDISDRAALVFAAVVRELGKPVGNLSHDASATRDRDLPLRFRENFLDGVAGACFSDHSLGEALAARPLFGLFHLDFLSWGGLTQAELQSLLGKYALTDAVKRDEDWQAVAADAERWLADLVAGLRAAAGAKSDLVALYLTRRHHYGSLGEKIKDELRDDLADE